MESIYVMLGVLVIVTIVGCIGLYGANKYSKHTPAH